MEKNKIDFPLVDLHIHIDGSLNPKLVYDIATEENIDLGGLSLSELEEKMKVDKECKSLSEFLEKFDIPLKVMQTKTAIVKLVSELVTRIANEGLVYAELRFAPQLHTYEGMTQQEAVDATIEGIKEARKVNDNIKINLILCCMRGETRAALNMETLQIAKNYLGSGVAGIDLAGDENSYPTSDYKSLFEQAKMLGVPFTIHAGEGDGPSSVMSAIDFGTSRLGHGVRAYEDEEIFKKALNKNTLFEICVSSNMLTNMYEDIKTHPIKSIYEAGGNICINTDDMTVCDTTLKKEFEILVKEFGFTRKELLHLTKNAILGSFMNENEKIRYIEILEEYK